MFSSFIMYAAVVAVLGFMVFVHELGHFVAAKAFGVRVLTFSLGFGKRLLGFVHGGTDYRISLLPLGGYVKMAGEDPSEVRPGDSDEFLAKPRWQRFIIAIAGPTMNVATAVLLLAGLYRFHYPKPAYLEGPARVGSVEAKSPAAKAGIEPGDLIVQFGSLQHPSWQDLRLKVVTNAGAVMPVTIERNGQTLHLSVTPKAKGPDEVGEVGMAPCAPAKLGQVEPNMPAAKAGLQEGDRITSLDGKHLDCWQQLVSGLQANGSKAATLTYSRKGKSFQASLTPVRSDVQGKEKWVMGVYYGGDVVVRQLPWGDAFVTSVNDNVRFCVVTFDVLGKIITHRMSARSLSGPIGIVQMSGQAYRAGLPQLLMLVAYISLQLGIFNLLPIPIFDGGMILMLFIESLMRRDISLEVKERFAQAGIVFLLLLAVFVTYNDIIKVIHPH